MSSIQGKSSKVRKNLQSKIMDFSSPKTSDDAKASSAGIAETAEEEGGNYDRILEAIRESRSESANRHEEMMVAIEGLRKDMGECTQRITHAEVRISNTEDEVTVLQATVRSLEGKKQELEDKVTDLESRARRSNLRLVGLQEGEEGDDACTFLESWIPETLGLAALRSKLTLERAHRVGQRREPNAPPRTVIMKFLNDRDKVTVLRAARAQKQILHKDKPVRFYPDLATGEHKKQKEFDSARQKLRSMGIKHGMLIPARLLVTHKDKTQTFRTPIEVESFIKRIQEENGSG